MKKFLLTLLCAAATMAGSAKEVYFDFNVTAAAYGMEYKPSNYNPDPTTISITDADQNVINVVLSKTSGNGTRLWSDGLRFYSGSNFEVKAPEDYVITKVEIGDYKKGDNAQGTNKLFTAPDGEGVFDAGTWTGSQSSIKLSYTGTSANPIASLKITYEEDSYAPANLAFAEASVSAELGKDFTAPELTKDTDGTPTYTSSNPDAATVDAETGAVTLVGAGVTTITATVAKTETHNPGSASYTLTVIDPNAIVITGDATFSFTTEGAYGITTSNSSFCTSTTNATEGEVSLKIECKSGSGYRIYSNSGNYELRLQQGKDGAIGNELTFTVPEGAVITSIEAAGDTPSLTFASETGSAKTVNKVCTWTSSETYKSNTVKASVSKALKISTIKVSYSITVSKPQTPIASDGENEFTHNDVITLKEESGKTLHFTLPEGMNLYYKFDVVKDNNSESSSDENIQTLAEHVPAEGFTKYVHEDGIKLTQSGKLSYYAEKNGVVGDTHVITVQNDATAIAEVEAGAGVTEWYDLSGRKVAAPGKGVYVRKQGSKVAKIAL